MLPERSVISSMSTGWGRLFQPRPLMDMSTLIVPLTETLRGVMVVSTLRNAVFV